MDRVDCQLAQFQDERRRLRRVAPLVVTFVVLLLAIVALLVHRDYRAELRGAERLAWNATLAFEREIGALLAEQRRAYEALTEHENDSYARLQTRLEAYAERLPGLVALSLVDAAGAIVAASLPGAAAPASNAGFDVLAPLRDPASGRLVLPLVWSVDAGPLAGGRVVGLLDVDVFHEILVSHELGAGGGATLLHADGIIVSRAADHAQTAGTDVRDPALVDELFASSGVMTLNVVSLFDEISRIAVFRRVQPYQLAVGAGAAHADVLAPWWGFLAVAVGLTAGLLVLGGALFGTLVRAHARQRRMLTTDSLTGLPNRRAIGARLQALVEGRQRGGAGPVTIVVDLDQFKLINHSLGHAVGDRVIEESAARLRAALPVGGILGHLGADTFAVLLERARASEVRALIERLRSTVGERLEALGTVHHLSCSVGYSRYPKGGESAEALLRNADLAMHQAKQRGGNCAVAYTSGLSAEVSRRMELVSRLREAIAREEFELHFQPQFAVDGRTAVGLEALVRWRHPERGLVGPAEFIGVAEDSGLIVPLGRWLLREAIACQASLARAGLAHLRMAVNVSAVQFEHGDLRGDVEALLAEHGVCPEKIELELTESVLVEYAEAAIELIAGLKAVGVAVSIDDFGTGYSSLSYLQRLPVDALKIDRGFVAGLPDDAGAAAICDTIIGLARNFGHSVIAEGVETAGQLRWLSDHGCDAVQGYLLARPMPFEEVVEKLRESVRT